MCWTAIADIIEDVMDVGFNSVLEDTSADDLSKHIYKLYCEWKIPEKRESVLNRLKNLPMPTPLQVEKIMVILYYACFYLNLYTYYLLYDFWPV